MIVLPPQHSLGVSEVCLSSAASREPLREPYDSNTKTKTTMNREVDGRSVEDQWANRERDCPRETGKTEV